AGELAAEVLVLLGELRADPDDDPRREALPGGGDLDDARLRTGLLDVGCVNPAEAAGRRRDHEPAAGIMAMHGHLLAGLELEGGVVAFSRPAADDDFVALDDRLVRELVGGGDSGRHERTNAEQQTQRI